MGDCVECFKDEHCPPDKKICELHGAKRGVCMQCRTDELDCGSTRACVNNYCSRCDAPRKVATRAVGDIMRGSCVECFLDSQCTGGQVCGLTSPDTGKCVAKKA